MTTITLTGNLGGPGIVSVGPSVQLTDTATGQIIPVTPVPYYLNSAGSFTAGPLRTTDDPAIEPAGWTYAITITLPGSPPQSYNVLLPSALGTTADLHTLEPVSAAPQVSPVFPYMPIPSGTPAAGDVPVATGNGAVTQWSASTGFTTAGTGLSGSGTTVSLSVPVSVADGGTGATTAGAALTSLGAASANGLSTETSRAQAAESLLAPKASPALTGSPTAPTAAALTDSTQIATTAYADAAVAAEASRAEAAEAALVPLSDLPLSIAHGGSGQVTQQAAINALTGAQSAGKVLRSDGTNATLAAIQAGDVPTLNQSTTGTAAGLSATLAITSGGTGQVTRQAALNALTGSQASAEYLRGDGTNVSMQAIQAADVPVLNQSTTGTAANITGTLDQVPAPAASVSMNSHKITSLANGTVSADAAAYGQTPAGGNTVTTAQGGTGQTSASAGFNALSPLTTPGDTLYGGTSGAGTRLAGNTSATRNFLTQTGTGTTSAAPSWGTIAAGDVPTLNQNTTGTAAGLSATLAVGSGGTGATSITGLVKGSGTSAFTAATPGTDYAPATSGTSALKGNGSGGFSAATLNDVGAATADYSLNSHKITSLASGTASTDAAAFGQIPVIDTTASDIKATSSAASAGTSTKVPAADHVHAQCFAGAFGDGSDGAVTLDGTATYSFLSKAGSTYTFTRDTYYASLTINSGVTLNVGNSRTYCTGTLTNNGSIISNGNAGQASGTAGTAASNWSFHAGAAGGAGNTGAGSAGTGITVNIGGASGGAGGTGSSGAAGAAGTNTSSAATHTEYLRVPATFATGQLAFASANQQIIGGLGGGGGGGDGTNKGGGGGAGGGVLGIAAASIVNNGTITATGGAGGTPATGNCGGGGGGGGGIVWTFSLAAPTGSGSMTAAGGSPGSGVGTGTAGASGSAGTVLNVVLA